jgi:hypothetical protein
MFMGAMATLPSGVGRRGWFERGHVFATGVADGMATGGAMGPVDGSGGVAMAPGLNVHISDKARLKADEGSSAQLREVSAQLRGGSVQ